MASKPLKPLPPPATDLGFDPATRALHADVRRLLKKHKSAFELHQVRARFMGAIASPIMDVSPMDEVKALFGGELPEVKNIAEINEILQVFVTGLWNRLTKNNDGAPAFELMPSGVVKNSGQLKQFALLRDQEIEGFIDGFYQGQDVIKLPEEVVGSVEVLEDLVSMFAGIVAMPEDPKATQEAIEELMTNLHRITDVAQKEMNAIITSSAQARSQGGESSPHTLH